MLTLAERPARSRASDHVRRFTIDGGADLEQRLEEVCDQVLAGILRIVPRDKIQALILAGGYGRGEGGVLIKDGRHLPYNDLEFYLFLNGSVFLNQKRFGDAIHHLSDELTQEAGVDVEIKIISRRKLQRAAPSVFYYDLVARHRPIAMTIDIFEGMGHHAHAANIPPSEATRLLMNRFTGLILARQRLAKAQFRPEDADFVGRNLAKAQLALGDAALVMYGQYHWSCRERHRRLRCLSLPLGWGEHAIAHHYAGVRFKLHPAQAEPSEQKALAQRLRFLLAQSQAVWLWVESQRLGRSFPSLDEYLLDPKNKLPEFNNPLWNCLLNLRSRQGKRVFRHPRERLFRMLPRLLWRRRRPRSEEKYLRLWPSVQ